MKKKVILDERAKKEIEKFSKPVRIKHRGQWRAIYAYILKNTVIVLSAFIKKTSKIPIKEINKAQRRLKNMTNKKNTVSVNEISKDFTKRDWQEVENEKKYYQIVVALRNEREKLGFTQAKLAEKSSLPRTTITKVESGARNTTLQTLMTMAQAMGKNLELKLL